MTWRSREEVNEYSKKIYLFETGEEKHFLSQEDYEEILYRQNGSCAICKKQCSTGRRLAVDHLHGTKIVRGLLCAKCNIGLGYFKDNPDLLYEAIRYLKINRVEGKTNCTLNPSSTSVLLNNSIRKG